MRCQTSCYEGGNCQRETSHMVSWERCPSCGDPDGHPKEYCTSCARRITEERNNRDPSNLGCGSDIRLTFHGITPLYEWYRDKVLAEHPEGIDKTARDRMTGFVTLTEPDLDEIRARPWVPPKPARKFRLHPAIVRFAIPAGAVGFTIGHFVHSI